MKKHEVKIHFAHRTFKWTNEAKGNAAVYCVIIGFASFDSLTKKLYEYENIKGEAHELSVNNISPYLIDSKDFTITKRSNPICNVPIMNFGNMPADGGELLFTDDEKDVFIAQEPKSQNYIKPLISAHEFLNRKKRWCLWLENIDPSELKKMPLVYEKIRRLKDLRSRSSRPQLAEIPHLFAQITQPKNADFILIPAHSSENRKYIPIGFFTHDNVSHNSCLIIPNGTLFHFGVLMSSMHMAWVKTVSGRLKSDFRYSKDIVYNNYPWPNSPTPKQIATIEEKAQNVLDARAVFPNSSLADLYNPLTMPPTLGKAHNELDKAVDAAYSKQTFTSDAKRMEVLFALYEKYTADLFLAENPKKMKKKSQDV